MSKYVLSVDQSTQGTKALIFDGGGRILARADLPHRQIVNEKGWVEHDPEEIWRNTLRVIRNVTEKAGVRKEELAVLGISNQRETSLCWNRKTGVPVYNAIVWQCRRTAELCEELKKDTAFTDYVRDHTGLLVDAYFSATKIKWILDNVEGAREKAETGKLLFGTVDTWLVWKLTGGAIENAGGRTAFDAMRAGDKAGTEVVNDYIRFVAVGTVNIVNMLQPEMICFGGGISNEGETLLRPVRELVKNDRYSRYCNVQTEICRATLGNDAGIIGAALL